MKIEPTEYIPPVRIEPRDTVIDYLLCQIVSEEETDLWAVIDTGAPITSTAAVKLEELTGCAESFWLYLEKHYRNWKPRRNIWQRLLGW